MGEAVIVFWPAPHTLNPIQCLPFIPDLGRTRLIK